MQVIQVFEHEVLRIGEQREGVEFTEPYFFAMLRLHEQSNTNYFSIQHQGIRFSSYVGVIQIPGLSIEILPKADNKPERNMHLWRNVLVEMLVACKWINFPKRRKALLDTKKGAVLEIFILAFLEEVQKVVHQGLLKKYNTVEGNINYWKGRVQIAKNFRNHMGHQQKVYTTYQQYERTHPFNQLLYQGLCIIPRLTSRHSLAQKARQLMVHFPGFKQEKISLSTFQNIRFNRHNAYYQQAIQHVHFLMGNQVPDFRQGAHPSFMLLFNMDYLFEAYIYNQLKKVENRFGIEVKKQVTASFWAKQKIRPDLVIHDKKSGRNYVIDTKWKRLASHKPPMEDLRQMFVYNQIFGAEKGLLLYPAIHPLSAKTAAFKMPESRLPGNSFQETYCTLGFVDILDNKGKLCRNIGKKVLEMFTTDE